MELGGDYNINVGELVEASNSIFDYLASFNTKYFDSGRSALKELLASLKQGVVLLPEFICTSVIDCFPHSSLRFYSITEDFQIDLHDLQSKVDANVSLVYVMHYFGCVQNAETLSYLRGLRENEDVQIIEDTTHSIFSSAHTVGDYCIASLRKWFPIPNGGVLYSRNKLPFSDVSIPKSIKNERFIAMILKTLFLNGTLDCNKEYREIFSNCEKELDRQKGIFSMSYLAEFLVGCFDIDELKQKRRRNYQFLKHKLLELGIRPACEIFISDCPFVLPIFVSNRDSLRQYMADNRIYCAVHWPFDGINLSERQHAKRLSEKLISLPIDQRYDLDAMQYMVDVLQRYRGNLKFSK